MSMGALGFRLGARFSLPVMICCGSEEMRGLEGGREGDAALMMPSRATWGLDMKSQVEGGGALRHGHGNTF